MHRRQGYVVGDLIRYVQFMHLRVEASDLIDECLFVRGAITHLIQKPLHVRFLDSLEVVSDAEVEHDAWRLAREAEFVVQRVN